MNPDLSHQNILSEKELIQAFAKKIFDRGMTVPAVFFLEMVKYASFIGSQMLVFFGPVITAFIRSEPYYRFTELLEDRKNVELLIRELEKLEKQSRNN